MMPKSNFTRISLVLLALGLGKGISAANTGSMDPATASVSSDFIAKPLGGGGVSGGVLTSEQAREILLRTELHTREIQTKFSLNGIAEAGPVLANLQKLLAQAREALEATNYPAVKANCDLAESQISILHNLGSRKLSEQKWESPERIPTNGSSADSALALEQMKVRANWDIQRTSERFNLLAQRLKENNSPAVMQLIERVRALLASAQQELSLNRFQTIRPILNQVEALFPELGRLSEPTSDLDKHGLSGTLQDSYQNQQPGVRTGLAQAMDVYNRVSDRVSRLRDQNKASQDAKFGEQLIRAQEMLEKCREALASGQAEAAKELSRKAEALVTELHQNKTKGGPSAPVLSTSALDRLKAKLDKASEIVRASHNEKAARILEKGLEHFEKAERGHADGQGARAQVEMDIALKLAAKAVDIARANQAR